MRPKDTRWDHQAMAQTSSAPIRKAIVRVTIASFSIAALMGIIALLGGGDFGETEGRILLTTLLVGVVSIAVLCYLATAGRRSQPVGIVGGVVVLVPLITALIMIWGDAQRGPNETILKIFGVGAIVAATIAQASLLLALAERARPLVQRILAGTLLLAAVLAVMTSLLVTGYDPGEDWYYRVLGVVAILDVLGTVVAAALMKFGVGDSYRTEGDVSLSRELSERVATYAVQAGRSRDDVVAEAVERFLETAEERQLKTAE
jgi:hypothetical protein